MSINIASILGGLMGGISQVGSGIASTVHNDNINRRNAQMQNTINKRNIFEQNKVNAQNQSNFERMFQESQRENQLKRDRADTAITRQMQDMKNAGVNPLMAGMNGGAQGISTTMPTMPTMNTAKQIAPEAKRNENIGKIIEGIDIANIMQDLEIKKAQTQNIKAQTQQTESTTIDRDRNIKAKDAEIEKLLTDTRKGKQDTILSKAQTQYTNARTITEREQAKNIIKGRQLIDEQITNERAKTELNQIMTKLNKKQTQHITKTIEKIGQETKNLEINEAILKAEQILKEDLIKTQRQSRTTENINTGLKVLEMLVNIFKP